MVVVRAPDCILLVPHPRDHELPMMPTAPASSSRRGRFRAPGPSGWLRVANSRWRLSRCARIAAEIVAPPQKIQLESGRQVGCGKLVATIFPLTDFTHAMMPALSFVTESDGMTVTSPVTPPAGV